MKDKWYRSNVAKAMLIVMAHVLVVVMTASFLWILSYPALREELFAGNPATKYEDSRNFVDQMLSYTKQVAQGLHSAEVVTKDGKYDPNQVVDIEAYYKKNVITGKNESGLAYRLGDLISEDDAQASDSDAGNEEFSQIIVCERTDGTYQYYLASDFYQKAKDGEMQIQMSANAEQDDSLQVIRDALDGAFDLNEYITEIQNKEGETLYKDCWVYDGESASVGNITPIGVDSVMALANQDSRWNGRLSEAYDMIKQVKQSLQDQYTAYKNIDTDIEEGDTNFYYIYVDTKNQHIYTNNSDFASYEQLSATIDKMKSLGKYVIVNPKLEDFETNMKDIDASMWRNAVKNDGLSTDQFLYMAAVDTKYPVQDNFYGENKLYSKYGAGARRIAIFGCAALLLLLGCFVWLITIAGRNDKDKELHLNAFDRRNTELSAVFIFLVWLIPTAFAVSAIDWGSMALIKTKEAFVTQGTYLSDAVVWIIAACVIAVYTCAMFMIGLLSLVRRLKAKILWKNSLLGWLLSFVRAVYAHMSMIWRSFILYLVFFLALWIVISMNCYGEAWAIASIMELVAFVYLMYKTIGAARISQAIRRISQGDTDYEVPTKHLIGEHKEIAENINSIGKGLEAAVAKSVKSERLKTDLITNVSHDIKTPLTSIINYISLLKQEHFEDERINHYIEVLDQKSQRLKTLTEDVVEASKASSGNLVLEYTNLNLNEMIRQVSGEFEERFAQSNLTEVLSLPDDTVVIHADGRRMWRVFENIYNNAAKYSLEGTRVYAELTVWKENAVFSLKNISRQALNISADELTERFIRGDISRSTEGSGLGLSIAKTLTQLQGGTFELYLDGDLFKATITFPVVK